MHETQNETARVKAEATQRLDALETALGNVGAGGLDAGDREALEWVKKVRAVE
jgi:hypothetical protein